MYIHIQIKCNGVNARNTIHKEKHKAKREGGCISVIDRSHIMTTSAVMFSPNKEGWHLRFSCGQNRNSNLFFTNKRK